MTLLQKKLKDCEDVSFVTWNPISRCIHHVARLADAQGVQFSCPCGEGHMVCVWFVKPDTIPPASGDSPPNAKRWSHSGSSLDDLTLSPSINMPNCWHGFVTDGNITNV